MEMQHIPKQTKKRRCPYCKCLFYAKGLGRHIQFCCSKIKMEYQEFSLLDVVLMSIFNKHFYTLSLKQKRKIISTIPASDSTEFFYIRLILQILRNRHGYWFKRCQDVLDNLKVSINDSEGLYQETLHPTIIKFGPLIYNRKMTIVKILSTLIEQGLKFNSKIFDYIMRTMQHTNLLFSEKDIEESVKDIPERYSYPNIEIEWSKSVPMKFNNRFSSISIIIDALIEEGEREITQSRTFPFHVLGNIIWAVLDEFYSEMNYGLRDWELFDAWFYLSLRFIARIGIEKSPSSSKISKIIRETAQDWTHR